MYPKVVGPDLHSLREFALRRHYQDSIRRNDKICETAPRLSIQCHRQWTAGLCKQVQPDGHESRIDVRYGDLSRPAATSHKLWKKKCPCPSDVRRDHGHKIDCGREIGHECGAVVWTAECQ